MRHELRAVNTAPSSENRMHGDEARRYGFSSGLVPGVDVLGYLAHAGVDAWGAAWLGGGRLHGTLARPVYDGEHVAVVAGADPDAGDSIDARVEGVAGGPDDVRATATLTRCPPPTDAELDRLDLDRFPFTVPPAAEERPPASREALVPGTPLGTQFAGFHADRATSYLDELSETHEAFRVDGCAHPGWLLRFSNWALSGTVRLGPWIHVASDARFFAPVRDGDELEVRAVVTDRYERKGHELVDLDVLYLVAGSPVAFVDHRAIWQPRLAAG